MKRSNVLEEVRKIIHENRPIDKGVTSNEISSMVLDKIEELGMLPPYCPIGSEREEGHIQLCQWEPEEDINDADNYCGAV